jgi:hypothetical protein
MNILHDSYFYLSEDRVKASTQGKAGGYLEGMKEGFLLSKKVVKDEKDENSKQLSR